MVYYDRGKSRRRGRGSRISRRSAWEGNGNARPFILSADIDNVI